MKFFVGFIIVMMFVIISLHYTSMEDVTFTVNKTERIQDQNSSKYLVFTDNEVFENTDTMLSFKFNSSDIYNKMNEGSVCNATVNWFRIPFLSSYRNIIEADCTKPSS